MRLRYNKLEIIYASNKTFMEFMSLKSLRGSVESIHELLLPNKPIRRPGVTPMGLLECSMTHRLVEAAFAKERPGSGSRDGFEKDLDRETSRKENGFKWRPPSGEIIQLVESRESSEVL
ncbi:hypothetical protein Zmor_002232 [Zophobas morio]|uniref:Uncharacterized protein n=1 Tax=Zophobas morio TaxID=2755281 RepID=A0AA38MTL0_9CUCU|nr:hypothetical protein Zmor_002232 [Zophobas morio]